MRVTRHFVVLLIPWRRIRGSNNLNARERGRARDRSDSTAEVTVRWERGSETERSSARGEEKDLPFSVFRVNRRSGVCVRSCWLVCSFFGSPAFFFFSSSFSSVLSACSTSLLSSLLQPLLLLLPSFKLTYWPEVNPEPSPLFHLAFLCTLWYSFYNEVVRYFGDLDCRLCSVVLHNQFCEYMCFLTVIEHVNVQKAETA